MATSISELIAQKDALERQIRDAQSAAKATAIANVRKLMADHGLTAADLIASAKSKAAMKSGSKVAAKYRDPITGSTWTGRGLKPKWMVAAIEAGKSTDDFRI